MMIVLRFQGCFIDVAGARCHRHGKPGAHGPWFRERRTGIRRIFCAFDHAHIVLGLRYCAAYCTATRQRAGPAASRRRLVNFMTPCAPFIFASNESSLRWRLL
jgi:hypothetical protein